MDVVYHGHFNVEIFILPVKFKTRIQFALTVNSDLVAVFKGTDKMVGTIY